MKKKIVFPLLFLLFTCLLFSWKKPKTAEAIPASGDVVEQLGGPIAKESTLTSDELMEKYNKSTTYQAEFFPFGDKDTMSFIGTARSFVKLSKASAEIAVLEARKISGYSEKELKESRNVAEKYEANAKKYTAADLLDIFEDVFGVSGSTIGSATELAKVAAVLSGFVDVSVNAKFVMGSASEFELKLAGLDAIASAMSLFGKLAPQAAAAGKVLGTATMVASVAYTTAKKYTEHQRLWSKFTDYVVARRKLDTFQKILKSELAPKLKEAGGLDIRFNAVSEFSEEAISVNTEVPVTVTFQARFARNCLTGEDAFRGTQNEDFFVAFYDFTYKGDLSKLGDKWAKEDIMNCYAEWVPVVRTACNKIAKERSECAEPFYAEATKSDQYLPMRIVSGKEGEGKLIFEGSLAESGSFEYNQGGRYEQEFEGYYVEDNETLMKRVITSSLILDKKGIRSPFYSYYWQIRMKDLTDKGNAFDDDGDFFHIKDRFELSKARMIVDFTTPIK